MLTFSINLSKFNIKQFAVLIACLLLGGLGSMAIIQTADAASNARKPSIIQKKFMYKKKFTKPTVKKKKVFKQKIRKYKLYKRRPKKVHKFYLKRNKKKSIIKRFHPKKRIVKPRKFIKKYIYKRPALKYKRPRPHPRPRPGPEDRQPPEEPDAPQQGTPPSQIYGLGQTPQGTVVSKYPAGNCFNKAIVGSINENVPNFPERDFSDACATAEHKWQEGYLARHPGCRRYNLIDTRTWREEKFIFSSRTGRRKRISTLYCEKTYRVCCGISNAWGGSPRRR
jgi:hypothetical protein